jgi:hypothetical protein
MEQHPGYGALSFRGHPNLACRVRLVEQVKWRMTRAARNVLSGGPPRRGRDAKAFQFEILRHRKLSGRAAEEAISTATRGSIAVSGLLAGTQPSSP